MPKLILITSPTNGVKPKQASVFLASCTSTSQSSRSHTSRRQYRLAGLQKENSAKRTTATSKYHRLDNTSGKVNILEELDQTKTKNELCQQKGCAPFLFRFVKLRGSESLPTISVNKGDLPAVITLD
ncbi:hypothetical protein OUZ56_009805 [Daphnia magna]|uniref:Uncharacterized protein n=1 Tax=Daphnia magna TaxID=35525 RepID=A0ABR0AH44_9CRUS|nr:hypothetical protein OUZ56_009805 [Daphnia magna]